jgi:hypothetical protein
MIARVKVEVGSQLYDMLGEMDGCFRAAVQVGLIEGRGSERLNGGRRAMEAIVEEVKPEKLAIELGSVCHEARFGERDRRGDEREAFVEQRGRVRVSREERVEVQQVARLKWALRIQ